VNSQLGAALIIAIVIFAVATAALRPFWVCPPRRRRPQSRAARPDQDPQAPAAAIRPGMPMAGPRLHRRLPAPRRRLP